MVNKWIIYQYIKQYIYTGWWLTYPSEKYELVSWDYDIPNMWKNKHVPKHQSDRNMIDIDRKISN